MGMSFKAGKISDYCDVCKRFDYETHFETDIRMFKESPDCYDAKDGRALYICSFVMLGVPELFARHVKKSEHYHGHEAIEKWKAIEDGIKKNVYKKVMKLLKDGDGWFYAF